MRGDWKIEIQNQFGEWLEVRQKDGYELRLQVGEPDRLYLVGTEVHHRWRVWRDGVLFSRDSHLFETAVASNTESRGDG